MIGWILETAVIILYKNYCKELKPVLFKTKKIDSDIILKSINKVKSTSILVSNMQYVL